MGNLSDGATSLVATAPSPATSGTSLVVTAGEGVVFPATPFYAIVHPDGSLPLLYGATPNAEVVQVTGVSTDTLTIVRARKSTTAKSIAVTWRISNAFFKSDYDDKQDLDTDLTTIAGLTATTDNIIQSVSSAWASRTPAQVKATLALVKGDVGLGNVDNTSDATKNAAAVTLTNKTLTSPAINTPTGIVKGDVGLGNVDNTSDATKNAATVTLTNKTLDSTSPTAFFYPGFFQPCGLRTAPSGWLICDGSAVSRTTYSGLFAALCESIGNPTMTIAAPAVVTMAAHGLVTGDQVFLTTTGALPTGLTVNTLYYVVFVSSSTFNLATTRANAVAGTKITTTGSQSGTHTLRWCPYGLGDGSTTFNVPDFRGRTIAGADAMGGTAASRLTLADALGSYGMVGATGGEQRHTLTVAELASHRHVNSQLINNSASGTGSGAGWATNGGASGSTDLVMSTAGSDTPHNLISPTAVANYIVKT